MNEKKFSFFRWELPNVIINLHIWLYISVYFINHELNKFITEFYTRNMVRELRFIFGGKDLAKFNKQLKK